MMADERQEQTYKQVLQDQGAGVVTTFSDLDGDLSLRVGASSSNQLLIEISNNTDDLVSLKGKDGAIDPLDPFSGEIDYACALIEFPTGFFANDDALAAISLTSPTSGWNVTTLSGESTLDIGTQTKFLLVYATEDITVETSESDTPYQVILGNVVISETAPLSGGTVMVALFNLTGSDFQSAFFSIQSAEPGHPLDLTGIFQNSNYSFDLGQLGSNPDTQVTVSSTDFGKSADQVFLTPPGATINYENNLTLELTPPAETTINAVDGSQIIIRFHLAADASGTALTFDETQSTPSETFLTDLQNARNIEVDVETSPNWTLEEDKSGLSPAWVVNFDTVVFDGTTVKLKISNLACVNVAAGTSLIHIAWSGLEGYDNGELVVPIVKIDALPSLPRFSVNGVDTGTPITAPVPPLSKVMLEWIADGAQTVKLHEPKGVEEDLGGLFGTESVSANTPVTDDLNAAQANFLLSVLGVSKSVMIDFLPIAITKFVVDSADAAIPKDNKTFGWQTTFTLILTIANTTSWTITDSQGNTIAESTTDSPGGTYTAVYSGIASETFTLIATGAHGPMTRTVGGAASAPDIYAAAGQINGIIFSVETDNDVHSWTPAGGVVSPAPGASDITLRTYTSGFVTPTVPDIVTLPGNDDQIVSFCLAGETGASAPSTVPTLDLSGGTGNWAAGTVGGVSGSNYSTVFTAAPCVPNADNAPADGYPTFVNGATYYVSFALQDSPSLTNLYTVPAPREISGATLDPNTPYMSIGDAITWKVRTLESSMGMDDGTKFIFAYLYKDPDWVSNCGEVRLSYGSLTAKPSATGNLPNAVYDFTVGLADTDLIYSLGQTGSKSPYLVTFISHDNLTEDLSPSTTTECFTVATDSSKFKMGMGTDFGRASHSVFYFAMPSTTKGAPTHSGSTSTYACYAASQDSDTGDWNVYFLFGLDDQPTGMAVVEYPSPVPSPYIGPST